ncbi:MAG: hypothetical protein KBE65_12350 [Phycisphaerae bacterium]|nr:hypothetical protein [Phycisphaerae bacterium]
MKKTSVCVLLACLLMASSAAATPAVSVKRNVGYFAGDGGEFTLTPNSELAALLGSAAKFGSFCLEIEEPVGSKGQKYNVEINDEALGGGTITDEPLGDEGGDTLNDLTAYLYSEFRAGTLAGYNYVAGDDRAASAGALQNVVWYLEDEAGMTWTPDDGSLEDQFYKNASDAVAAGWTNDGSVVVLNLYTVNVDGSITPNQSMIGLIPTIPAPGAIVLCALGSCVVGFLRRRHMM